MRPTCAAGWARRRSTWRRRRTAPGKRSGAPPSPRGCRVSSWPQRPVLITAVDAATGEPVVFDRHSGVDLVDAVAASCASGLSYRIGDHRYIDGGYRRNAENADLAAGYATGARAVTVRRPNTAPAGLGHASRGAGRRAARRAAAGSRRSSRTAAPSTCSAPTRWIRRCVRPLLEPVTTRAEPSPSSSPNSGADAHQMGRRAGPRATAPTKGREGSPASLGPYNGRATFVRSIVNGTLVGCSRSLPRNTWSGAACLPSMLSVTLTSLEQAAAKLKPSR